MNCELMTPVALPPSPLTLGVGDEVMTLGSCFAQNVGERLQRAMGAECVDVNPFGVLYNPMSIAEALRVLLYADEAKLHDRLFEGRDGLWHSWLHSTHFSGSSREECLRRVTARLRKASSMLRRARALIVTFGTTRCYHLKADGSLVANCHKEPAAMFCERDPEFEKMLGAWQTVVSDLRRANPALTVILTVSPYRYRKYGFHESQLQKARLLLLADALCSGNEGVAYFPAYEIMLDELRDYRFWATDMLHPSEQAADIITTRFREWTFAPDLQTAAEINIKEWRRSQHRQLHAE